MPLNVKRTDSGFELCSHAELAYDVDVVVLGGGPAGVAAAFSAASLGQKVLLVEQFNCLVVLPLRGGMVISAPMWPMARSNVSSAAGPMR